jgi:hypothetical protein
MMSNVECPYCGYELDSWNDCVSVNNILECPECEEHFELKAVRLNKPQLNTAKKYIEHVIGTIKHDGHLGTIQTDWILTDLEKALAAIGGDDE